MAIAYDNRAIVGCGSRKENQRMAIYKRMWKKPNGTKTVRYYFHKTIDGVRHRVAIPTARTLAQAEEAARDILLQIHQGKYNSQKEQRTLKEIAQKEYLSWAKNNKKSWKSDESILHPILKEFGDKRPSQISESDVEKYKVKRLKSKTRRDKSPAVSTINKELKMLSRLLKLGKVKNNPCDEVKKLKGETKRMRWLKPEEEEKLMQQLTGKRAHLIDIVELDLHLGLRRGELLSLEIADCDFTRRLVIVQKSKTGEGREVPMNSTAKAILLRLVEQAQTNGWKHLFTNPKTGKRYTEIKHAWESALKDAGIEDLTFHDLRHTFITRALDSGAPITGVRDAVGHKSLSTTNRYAHATEEGMRRAVEAQEGYSQRSGHKSVTHEKRQAS